MSPGNYCWFNYRGSKSLPFPFYCNYPALISQVRRETELIALLRDIRLHLKGCQLSWQVSTATVMSVNINYFISQQSRRGHRPAEALPQTPTVAAGMHQTDLFKSSHSETAAQLSNAREILLLWTWFVLVPRETLFLGSGNRALPVPPTTATLTIPEAQHSWWMGKGCRGVLNEEQWLPSRISRA